MPSSSDRGIICEIPADLEALAQRVAGWLLAAARSQHGSFALALSGGTTPRRLYEVLAEPPYRDDFPWPRFDVVLLGLGPDGHPASLFPGSAVLKERDRWVAAVLDAKSEPRITLTYTALESCRRTAFLVAGSEKRAILARFRAGDDALP